jgi:aryl-alcohol dehydrogenase-like predicted oxidoreductase
MNNTIFWCWNISAFKDINLLEFAYKKGIIYFDTSPAYWKWNSESILWSFIKDKRSKVFIATKTPIEVESKKDIISHYWLH